jgi:hypothetical protein
MPRPSHSSRLPPTQGHCCISELIQTAKHPVSLLH